MKIIILSGSVRPERQSHHVATYLTKLINQRDGIEAELIDLIDYPLPALEHSYRLHPEPTEAMNALKQKLDDADGIIFLTPEYHGSYSGVLKNAIDHFRWPFFKKPVGIAAISAGALGGMRAALQLDQLTLSLMAIPSPFKLLVKNVKDTYDSDGAVTDNAIADAQKFIDEFLWLTRSIATTKAIEKRDQGAAAVA